MVMMKQKLDRIIRIVLGGVFIFSFVEYLILSHDWAKPVFYIFLALICLYNLFFIAGHPKEKNN